MGDKTGIAWTRSDDGTAGSTWNPVSGCTQVSPGCDHCYAKDVALRFPNAYPNGFDVTLWPNRLQVPLRWGRGRMVFVNSMSDLFHADVPDWYIAQMFAVMAASPRHTYQILTKRHARMRSLLTSDRVLQGPGGWMSFEDIVRSAYVSLKNNQGRCIPEDAPRSMKEILTWPKHDEFEWPLRNVWLGVTVENQKWADIRVPALLDTPAAVRFLSMEPLLGPVNLTHMDVERYADGMYWINALTGANNDMGRPCPDVNKIDWVIVGGESGPKARPMHPAWVRSLRDQCARHGTPYWFKQFGEWVPVEPDVGRNRAESDWLVRMDGYAWPLVEPHGAEDGTEVTVRRVGKRNAGNLLDGEVIEQRPKALS